MQYCAVKTAFEIAERARAGETVAVAALEHALDEIVHPGDGPEYHAAYHALVHALLASNELAGVYRALREQLPDGAEIRGILFDEGDPLAMPFPDNPWRIAPGATIVEAIDQIWDLDAPTLVNALLARMIEVVLVDLAGAPHLAYLQYTTTQVSSAREPPHDRRYAVAWLPFGQLDIFLGAAPAVPPAPALEPLYGVHGALRAVHFELLPPDQIADGVFFRPPHALVDGAVNGVPFLAWLDGMTPFLLGISAP